MLVVAVAVVAPQRPSKSAGNRTQPYKQTTTAFGTCCVPEHDRGTDLDATGSRQVDGLPIPSSVLIV